MIKKILSVLVLGLLAFAVVSCGTETAGEEEVVTLNHKYLDLVVGQTTSLIPETDVADPIISWHSDTESVATVSAIGSVTATGIGKAKITVSLDSGANAICMVFVKHGIALDKASETLVIEKDNPVMPTFDLIATVSPVLGSTENLLWYTNNPSIATVEATATGATVTAVKAGNVLVYATTPSGVTATCAVTVETDVKITTLIMNVTCPEVYAWSEVHLAGNNNDWGGISKGFMFTRIDDTHFTITIVFDYNENTVNGEPLSKGVLTTSMQFKICLGIGGSRSWDFEELDGTGKTISNRGLQLVYDVDGSTQVVEVVVAEWKTQPVQP